MSDWRNDGETEAEKRMWKARRELYLCCSRSTCFLHFIHQPGDESSNVSGPASEVAELVAQLSQPENHDDVCRRIWSLGFRSSGITRTVPTYTEAETSVAEPPPDLKSVMMNRPVTAKALAAALGLQVSVLIEPLSALRFTLRTVKDIIPDSTAKELALKFGTILEITDGESGLGGEIPPQSSVGISSGNQPDSPAGVGGVRQPESPTPPVPPREGVNEFETALIQFAKSWEFKQHNAKVGRYLALLSWLLGRKAELRDVLLRYDRGNRKYFATSKEEIDRFANAANAKRFPASDLWALTTTSTDLKLSVLNDVMHGIGISLPARQEVLRQF
jgi:negative regulator of replication initiation